MELDEALDIQGLTIPIGSPMYHDFSVKINAQRLLIREFLHMFNNVKKSFENSQSSSEGAS